MTHPTSLRSRITELIEAANLDQGLAENDPNANPARQFLLAETGKHACVPKIVANRPPLLQPDGFLRGLATLRCIGCGRRSLTVYHNQAQYSQLAVLLKELRRFKMPALFAKRKKRSA